MSGRTLRRLPVLAHARYIGLAPPTRAPVNGVDKKDKRSNKHSNKYVF